jgi:hypothetical protein
VTPAPKTPPPSPLHVLEQAEKLLGRKKIAEGLKVSESVIESWCNGSGTLSNSHLLRLADLLAKYASSNK